MTKVFLSECSQKRNSQLVNRTGKQPVKCQNLIVEMLLISMFAAENLKFSLSRTTNSFLPFLFFNLFNNIE